MKNLLMAMAIFTLLMYSCEKEANISPILNDSEAASAADDIIPGKYIVILNGGVSSLKSAIINEAARKDQVREEASQVLSLSGINGRDLDQVFGSAIRGFSLSLNEEEVAALKDQKNVYGIWEDRVVTLGKPSPVPVDPPAQSIPYGITRVGGGISYTGSHVAWIIDTGIDLDHPDLNVDVARSKTFVTRTTSPEDDNGHGSHCAGIVAAINNDIGVVGVAAGATVVAVKVLNKRGSGTMTEIISGVDYVAANAQAGDAANMSLGGGVYEPLDLAVQNLGEAGVMVALAAGNETDDANNHSPARANGPNLYTVSAMDINDLFASFSNYGNPPIEYCAPGVSILSTYKSGGYTSMSGTSMAAPHVCGLLLATGGNIVSDGNVNGDPDGNPDPIAHN